MERKDFLTGRERRQRELTALDARARGADRRLDGLAELIGSVARGWALATQAQRHRLAHLLFEEVLIEDGRIAAVKARPEVAGLFALDTKERGLSVSTHVRIGGSDGGRVREIDVVEPPLVPFLYPERVLRSRQATARTAINRPTRISEGQLPVLVARIEREGLRPVAQSLGVSHETLRTALLTGGYKSLLADAGRKHHLASAAPPPPPAPAKVPRERYSEVTMLCQRHTQAEVAVMLGVSQTTVWRIMRQLGRGADQVETKA